ncbi:hypothetical protein D3OALGB2SA_644 [Olavius algarvensis associated proteobacterium Delta 3]|nr:hypothetical protein D3OALGB2SA_644 [Olavius algarvensis associated proteobacterium Delta 3]
MKYKNGTCYSCCETKRLTEEHIIPQALGGRLSSWIYCKSCNDKFGNEIDAELIKNIGYFGTALNIKRIRGKNPPYDVTSIKKGTKLTFDGKEFKRKRPIVKIEKDGDTIKSVDVTAGTKSELHQICSDIKKKFKLSNNTNYFEEYHLGPTDTKKDFVFDNSAIRRCVSKVAYSLLCIKLPSDIVLSDSFDEVRNYIRFGTTGHLATANYVHTSFMTDNIRPLHKIHISMNRRKNLVIGFICFFWHLQIFCFVI